jgi:predicted nuclease of predicted toxin-antitoxin system
MRILVDQNLPLSVLGPLLEAGHDVVHTSCGGLSRATDPEIFEACRAEDRVLVTADKRLVKYLVDEQATDPSIIIARGFVSGLDVADALVDNLQAIDDVIATRGDGVFSMVKDKPTRVTLLPIGR